MSQKKWKFNVIDVIAVVLILAVAVFIATKVGGKITGGSSDMVPIRYTVLAEAQPAAIAESVQDYIPGSLMASGTRYDIQVVDVQSQPTLVLGPDGTWVEDPNHVDLTFTVEGQIEKADVLVATAGTQEIRIGKEIILKTEYLEFEEAVVTSVEYPSADSAQ